MHRRVTWILFCGVGLVIVTAAAAHGDAPANLSVSPGTLAVGTFFSGGELTISGEIPSESEVAIEVAGPEVEGRYDLKGRVGPFWLTRGSVELANAPEVYLLLMPSWTDWEKKADAQGLGIEHLRSRISISHADVAADDIFHMFVKLKSAEGLYGESPGAIAYGPAQGGSKRFTAKCRLPSSVQEGVYTVQAVITESGVQRMAPRCDLTVEQVGFIKLVNQLASNRRLAYGLAAVVIALLAGAFMGLIFKGSGSH
jgi:hypothetical protein